MSALQYLRGTFLKVQYPIEVTQTVSKRSTLAPYPYVSKKPKRRMIGQMQPSLRHGQPAVARYLLHKVVAQGKVHVFLATFYAAIHATRIFLVVRMSWVR